MNIDDLLKNARRMEPPATLKTKVEEEIAKRPLRDVVRDDTEPTPSWIDWVTDLLRPKRLAWSLAAVALAVVLTVKTIPDNHTAVVHESATLTTTEIDTFIDSALVPVYISDGDTGDNNHTDGDIAAMDIESQIDEIYWINGGNDA